MFTRVFQLNYLIKFHSKMCDNIENCCRICLDVESDLVPVLENPSIALHIKSCLSVIVSPCDELPKKVCVSCVFQLNQFYSFLINARCSQDWLESSLQEKCKKSIDNKILVQPLPDSEYNSDSLLEFLNNTSNIEEYLNNLGKEDIPSIVNMLEKTEHPEEVGKTINFKNKIPSPVKKESAKTHQQMEIDILDSDIEVVKDILKKKTGLIVQKITQDNSNKNLHNCFACNKLFYSVQQLLKHMSMCDFACRTCIRCNKLFDSKHKMQQHSITHNISAPMSCNCGELFDTKEKLIQHHKVCHTDYASSIGCIYRCKKCGKSFKERFQLYKHAKKHVVQEEERICDICGHKLIGKEAFVKHKKENHAASANIIYRCKVCNLSFKERTKVYLHIKSHQNKADKKCHLCESCGKSFTTLASLLRHLQQHNATFCMATDNNLFNYQNNEQIQPTICEKCGDTVDGLLLNMHLCKLE